LREFVFREQGTPLAANALPTNEGRNPQTIGSDVDALEAHA
jgi:hypothetical protein